MLLAIAVTSWHSQSYQLIIHDCRIRWQHDLTLLLQLLQVCTYLRHPLVSHKPFHDIVNTPRLIIVNLWVNETEPLHVPLLTFESWHFFSIRWGRLSLRLHLQFNAQCIQDVRLMQMLHMLDVDAPRLHIHLREMGNTQTDAKIEPIFDPIYAKISRNADG